MSDWARVPIFGRMTSGEVTEVERRDALTREFDHLDLDEVQRYLLSALASYNKRPSVETLRLVAVELRKAQEETCPTPDDGVNHPAHYGGADNPYEAIKVIDAWQLGFCLGNVVKYIARGGKKHPDLIADLKKGAWYLNHEIENLEKKAAS